MPCYRLPSIVCVCVCVYCLYRLMLFTTRVGAVRAHVPTIWTRSKGKVLLVHMQQDRPFVWGKCERAKDRERDRERCTLLKTQAACNYVAASRRLGCPAAVAIVMRTQEAVPGLDIEPGSGSPGLGVICCLAKIGHVDIVRWSHCYVPVAGKPLRRVARGGWSLTWCRYSWHERVLYNRRRLL